MSEPDVAPRYCSEHPDLALVPLYSRAAPADRWRQQRACPSPEHGLRRHRCAWCGGLLTGPATWAAVYCGTRCRVAAFRSSRNAAIAASPAGDAGAPPGTTTAGMSPAADAPKGGHS